MGSVEALEALQLATLNVVSFGIMVAGGVGWGFDICGVGELRARVGRRRVGVEGGGDGGGDAEELEGLLPEWVVGMVGGKDGGGERAKRRGGGEEVDEIRSREEKREGGVVEERFAVVEERTVGQGEKSSWKPW